MSNGERDVSLAQPQDNIDPGQDGEAKRSRRPRPKHDFPETQAGKMWKALGNPDNPANEMPGGMVNTAGGRPREVTWRDAFRFDVFGNENRPAWYQQPCARDSLLVGIGAGGAVGGLRFILRGLSGMLATTNYMVGIFAVGAAGQFYWCQRRRKEEARGMAAAVAGMKMLHEKKAREEAAAKAKVAEEAAQKKQEEERQKASKSWYKLW